MQLSTSNSSPEASLATLLFPDGALPPSPHAPVTASAAAPAPTGDAFAAVFSAVLAPEGAAPTEPAPRTNPGVSQAPLLGAPHFFSREVRANVATTGEAPGGNPAASGPVRILTQTEDVAGETRSTAAVPAPGRAGGISRTPRRLPLETVRPNEAREATDPTAASLSPAASGAITLPTVADLASVLPETVLALVTPPAAAPERSGGVLDLPQETDAEPEAAITEEEASGAFAEEQPFGAETQSSPARALTHFPAPPTDRNVGWFAASHESGDSSAETPRRERAGPSPASAHASWEHAALPAATPEPRPASGAVVPSPLRPALSAQPVTEHRAEAANFPSHGVSSTAAAALAWTAAPAAPGASTPTSIERAADQPVSLSLPIIPAAREPVTEHRAEVANFLSHGVSSTAAAALAWTAAPAAPSASTPPSTEPAGGQPASQSLPILPAARELVAEPRAEAANFPSHGVSSTAAAAIAWTAAPAAPDASAATSREPAADQPASLSLPILPAAQDARSDLAAAQGALPERVGGEAPAGPAHATVANHTEASRPLAPALPRAGAAQPEAVFTPRDSLPIAADRLDGAGLAAEATPRIAALPELHRSIAVAAGEIRRPAKTAAAAQENFTRASLPRNPGAKSFLSAEELGVTPPQTTLGIDVAKPAPAMAVAPSPELEAPVALRTPAFSIEAAYGNETHAASVQGHGEVSESAETEAVPATAPRAVEIVLHSAERVATREQQAVNLRFSVGGEDLAVRVELHANEVRAIFRAESPELRAALAQEWTAAAPGAPRAVTPVFTSGDAGAFSAFNGEAAAQQRDHARRTRDEKSAGAISRARRAATSSPVVADTSEPAGRPLSRRAGSSTSRHLHTLA